MYIGEVRPYVTRYQNRLDLLNETLIFFLIYHLIIFSEEYKRSKLGREYSGYSMIFFTVLLLLANLGQMAVIGIRNKINMFRLKYRKKKALELREKAINTSKTKSEHSVIKAVKSKLN
jgi:hypothetical protein